MLAYPLYLAEITEGIPIPSGKYYLHAECEKLGFMAPGDDIFCLGIYCEPTSNDTDFQSNVHQIGVLAQVIGLEETNIKAIGGDEVPGYFVELRIMQRVLINRSTISDSDQGDWLVATVDLETFTQEDQDPSLLKDIQELVNIVQAQATTFNVPVHSVSMTNELPSAQLDIMAQALLQSKTLRLGYLQTRTVEERYKILHSFVTSKVKSARPTKERKEEDSTDERLKTSKAPRAVKKKLARELERLNSLNKTSVEHASVSEYLNWSLGIPWGKYSQTRIDLKNIVKHLDESHYGLNEVKEHVLEHMAIEKLTGGVAGTVMCFLGPPGTGKTSIAKQIAAAIGRPLIRIALGGISDEAEIRGHRRTYAASRPGRFITSLKEAGQMDPIYLLDEIDKVSSFKGDPTAAMLELLDPEQNDHFTDNYLEFPVDLSKAMFICTANYREQIPPALLDRMEFIHFRAYEYEERLEITRNFIVPQSIATYQMKSMPIDFTDEAMRIVSEEPQVRQIEKQVKKLLRRAAVALLVHGVESVTINADYIQEKKPQQAKVNSIGFASRK